VKAATILTDLSARSITPSWSWPLLLLTSAATCRPSGAILAPLMLGLSKKAESGTGGSAAKPLDAASRTRVSNDRAIRMAQIRINTDQAMVTLSRS
jgi:hypothetical protein